MVAMRDTILQKSCIQNFWCFFFYWGTNYESSSQQKVCINQNNYQNVFSIAMATSLLPQNEIKTIRTFERICKFAGTRK